MSSTSIEQITDRIPSRDTVIDLCIDKKSIKPRSSNYDELVKILPDASICVVSNREGDLVYKLNRRYEPTAELNVGLIVFTLPFDNGTGIGDTLKISIDNFSTKSIFRVYKIINGVPFECVSVTGEQRGKPNELIEILFPIKEITGLNDIDLSDEQSEEPFNINKPIYSADPINVYNEQTRIMLRDKFLIRKKKLIKNGYRSKKYTKKLSRLLKVNSKYL